MDLSNAQLVTLRDHIAANPAVNTLPHTPDNAQVVADVYNLDASPVYWVWRTWLPTQELYDVTTPEGTSWNWDLFEGLVDSKLNTWREMNRSDGLNMSLPNVQAAIGKIWSTAPQAPQKTHILTAGRRRAQLGERLYAQGTGSTAVPGTMAEEGDITRANVEDAWAQPSAARVSRRKAKA